MLEQIADSIISSLNMDEGDKSKYELDLWGIKELLHNLANILTMIWRKSVMPARRRLVPLRALVL